MGATHEQVALRGRSGSPGEELDGLLSALGARARLGHARLLDAQVPALVLVQFAQVEVVAALVHLVKDSLLVHAVLGVDSAFGIHGDVESRFDASDPHLPDVVRKKLQDRCESPENEKVTC